MKKDTIINFYSTYKFYIFPSIVALSSLFLIIFAIYPQTAKLLSNQKTEGDLINKSKFLETKVSALESLDQEDLSSKVKIALKAYPADKDFGDVIGLLQQEVGQSGFSITSISLGSNSSSGGAQSYEIRLQVSGVKPLLENLLTNLENSSRILRVNSIEVSSSINQKIEVSLVVGVVYSAIPSDFGSIDSPLPQISQKDEQLIARLASTTSSSGTSQPPSQVSSPSQTTPGSSGPLPPRGKPNPFE